MSFLDDIVKIKYVREGYLPDYPPEFHSLSELYAAFLPYPVDDTKTSDELWEQFRSEAKSCWFSDTYPLVDRSLEAKYRALVEDISYHLQANLAANGALMLPDWVYSYMLGATIGPMSPKLDIHDLLVLLGCDNISDEFTVTAANQCYEISDQWLRRLANITAAHRSPTIFGEPHVIKSLRLQQSSM